MIRRSSLRAQVQQFYCDMVEDDARGREKKVIPGPSPSAAGGGGDKKVQTDLTARVRALYEGSAVPVREIARLAGVSERTVYKYVARHGWQKRYGVKPRGEAAAAANRGRRMMPAPSRARAKGAGGRFIRREDRDKPLAAGFKALHPAGLDAGALARAGAGPVAQGGTRRDGDGDRGVGEGGVCFFLPSPEKGGGLGQGA